MDGEIKTISPRDFPPLLNEINDPPELLYYRGTLPEPDAVLLSVVGSRKYTPYGKDACTELIKGLRGSGIVIVSGLAIGIDAIAHRAALDAGLRTIAFPGSGLKDSVLYPASNLSLAREIIEKGGALMGEFPPDFEATQWSFPQRNRLMAGVSKAVLVIEAEEKSGTLITARLALDYNRDVYAVPASIFSPNGKGVNKLIFDGALPVTSSGDILESLGLKGNTPPVLPLVELDGDEKKVFSSIEDNVSIDELASKTGLPIARVHVLITILEMKGLVSVSGGHIRRVL